MIKIDKSDQGGFTVSLMGIEDSFDGEQRALTDRIIGVFYGVYNELGFGFMEIVYKEAMLIALRDAGLHVEAEVNLPVHFRKRLVGIFRADLVVNNSVILELKVDERITKKHETQLLHYLRSCPIEIGLVMNFGDTATFRRVVMLNNRKKQTLNGSQPLESAHQNQP